MKLNVLMIPTTNSGVVYWRMYNYWMGLHRNGLADCHVLWWRKDITEDPHPWEMGLDEGISEWRITKELQDWVRKADIVVIQAVHSPRSLGLFQALKDLCPNTPIITEMDDDVTWTPANHPASTHYNPTMPLVGIAIEQLKLSDGLFVTTPWLKEVYSEYNDSICLAPNGIDFGAWGKIKPQNRSGIRIGWSGGASHYDDLKLIEPTIRYLSDKYRDIKFIFMHYCPDFLRGIKGVVHINKWARIDRYPKAIASQDFDIGIAPLADNLFNRCKSNLRWLEYSALGIPTVASNVGHFKQTLVNGQDAILVDNPSDFTHAIVGLVDDSSARKALALRANERVRKDFNIDKLSLDYAKNLEQFVNIGVKKTPSPILDQKTMPADLQPLAEDGVLVEGGTLEQPL